MPDPEGANPGESLTPKPGSAKEGGSLPPEELQAELERKTKEIEKLKSSNATAIARVEELEKLQDEGNLSVDEEEELAREKEKVRKTADKIKQTREFAPWELLIREQVSGAALEIVMNNEITKANDLVEDWALDEGFLKDGVTLKEATEKMARELAPFGRKYDNKSPSRRNELAYREWKKSKKERADFDEQKRKLKEDQDAAQRFRETGTRVPRDQTLDSKLKDARTPKEQASLLKDLVATAPTGES